MISKYLASIYEPGGRDYPYLDCYGLVRLVRSELFCKPMLPLCGAAKPGDKESITEAVSSVAGLYGMSPCEPKVGAVATAWKASFCVHVGIVVDVDGSKMVLETDSPAGPMLTRISAFKSRYSKVVFYDD